MLPEGIPERLHHERPDEAEDKREGDGEVEVLDDAPAFFLRGGAPLPPCGNVVFVGGAIGHEGLRIPRPGILSGGPRVRRGPGLREEPPRHDHHKHPKPTRSLASGIQSAAAPPSGAPTIYPMRAAAGSGAGPGREAVADVPSRPNDAGNITTSRLVETAAWYEAMPRTIKGTIITPPQPRRA